MNIFVILCLLLTSSVWAAPVHGLATAIDRREDGKLEFHFPGLNTTLPMFKANRENGTTGNLTEYYHSHHAKSGTAQIKNETNSALSSESVLEVEDDGNKVKVCIHQDFSENAKSDGYCRLGPGVTFGKGPNGAKDVNETSPEYQKINATPQDGYFHPRRSTDSSIDAYPKLNASLENLVYDDTEKYHPIWEVGRLDGRKLTVKHPILSLHKTVNTSEPWNNQRLPKDDSYGSCEIEAPVNGHAMPSSVSLYAQDCRDLRDELEQKSGFYLISQLYEPFNVASKGSCYFNVSRSGGDNSYVKLWKRDVATILKGLVGEESELTSDATIVSAFGVFQCNTTLMQWSVTGAES